MQLIPSMDLLGGRIVRLHQGDPAQATFYDLEPEAWIGALVAAGARRIHLVDLDGAFGQARQSAFAGSFTSSEKQPSWLMPMILSSAQTCVSPIRHW